MRNPTFQRSLAALFALATLLSLTPATAVASDFSYLGATTLKAGQSAGYATVGLPDAEIGLVFGLNSIADATPRLRLQFGRGTRIGGAGVAASAAVRMQVARTNRWTISLVTEPEVSVHLWGNDHPPTSTSGVPALAVTPFSMGVLADREVLPGVRVIAGIKVPVTVYLRPEWVLNVPVIAEVGAESQIADKLTLLARIDTGADFYGPGGLPGSEAYFRVRVGIGW